MTGKGSVNQVTLIGRLGGDPELKFTPNGAAVANFTLATSQNYKDKDGNPVEKTEWHKIVVWRKPAEIIAEYCKKGHRLYIDGHLETRSWGDGAEKKYMTEVVVDNFTFLESVKSNGVTSSIRSQDQQEVDNDDDGLPF